MAQPFLFRNVTYPIIEEKTFKGAIHVVMARPLYTISEGLLFYEFAVDNIFAFISVLPYICRRNKRFCFRALIYSTFAS